jgi:hypothetical protein
MKERGERMKKILAVLLIVGLLAGIIALADQTYEEYTIDNGEFSEEHIIVEGNSDPLPCGGGEGGSGGGGTPG